MNRFIGLIASLLVLSIACTIPTYFATEAVQINPSVREDDTEMNELIQKELTRVRSLLDESRVYTTLEEVQPLQPPEEIGALAGLGFNAYNPDVKVSVYVFDKIGQHKEAVGKLRESISADGKRIITTGNGRLLFFGYADVNGANGEAANDRLIDIGSAFAGDE